MSSSALVLFVSLSLISLGRSDLPEFRFSAEGTVGLRVTRPIGYAGLNPTIDLQEDETFRFVSPAGEEYVMRFIS